MKRFSGPDQVFGQVSGLSFFEDRTATFFSSLSNRNEIVEKLGCEQILLAVTIP
ncbi:MAG TPA: hypothetical protein VHF01_03805 [Candidatus Acidoferrum sp.]|nr:hypothetical protein [Candidatus Acidoferrum sp.]